MHKATRRTYRSTVNDWTVSKRDARYLKKNTESVSIASWSDSDFAADKTEWKSGIGGEVTLDGASVLWVCKKQTGVSLSTTDAEFTSASRMGCETTGNEGATPRGCN